MAEHVWVTRLNVELCKFCYIYKYLPKNYDCIKLPIKLEAKERASKVLKERYYFAMELANNIYMDGSSNFLFKYFFPKVKGVPKLPCTTNRLYLHKKLIQWIEDAFIEQYKVENETKLT